MAERAPASERLSGDAEIPCGTTSIEVAPPDLSLHHSLAGLLVSDTRPRPTATPSNLEGELNLAGAQCVSSSSPKLGPSERSEPNRKIGREPRSARGDGKAQVTASAVVRGAEGIATRPNINAGGVCLIQIQNTDYQLYTSKYAGLLVTDRLPRPYGHPL